MSETWFVPDTVRRGAMSIRIGGTDQSYVDPHDPTHLEYDYVQRIADLIDAHAAPGERLRVVHLGGAGMTLARYVAHTRPTSAQIVCEPDAELTDLVREHLPLPRRSGIKVRPVDGRSGVAAMPDGYADIVVVDAFAGARVPAELGTSEFIAELRRILTGAGVVCMNVTDRGPFDYARRLLAGFDTAFEHLLVGTEPATLKGRRFGNLVLLASPAGLPVDVLTRRWAAAAFPYRIVQDAALRRLIGAATPFTDTDRDSSPPPPSGRTAFG